MNISNIEVSISTVAALWLTTWCASSDAILLYTIFRLMSLIGLLNLTIISSIVHLRSVHVVRRDWMFTCSVSSSYDSNDMSCQLFHLQQRSNLFSIRAWRVHNPVSLLQFDYNQTTITLETSGQQTSGRVIAQQCAGMQSFKQHWRSCGERRILGHIYLIWCVLLFSFPWYIFMLQFISPLSNIDAFISPQSSYLVHERWVHVLPSRQMNPY